MTKKTYLRIEDVGLDVPLYVQSGKVTKSWTGAISGAAFTRPKRSFVTLLDGITFDAGEGDRIAIIGRNGAGKSTLLQVLTGAYQPTRGAVATHGTRHALMNMSLGFNPEATVLENILLRSSAMGTPLAEVRELIDQILDFSGLEEKASHRLRTLSSGQRMRLGFAISTSTQHDIMLLDEWIGTGDAEFIQKATNRMMGRVGVSKIVVLASHSIGLLGNICNKGLVLDRGRAIYFGGIKHAIREYRRSIEARRGGAVAG